MAFFNCSKRTGFVKCRAYAHLMQEGDYLQSNPMRFRPAAVLVILAMINPELITGSTLLMAFLDPGIVLFLFVVQETVRSAS
jgi:hypothetical protein